MGHPFFVSLQKQFHAVYLKYTHIAKLPDFVGVQQLHSSCAFVEVVAEGDAAVPVLDFAGACPKGEVEGLGGLEEFP